MALHVLFLLSGVTGLIYEVAWTRAFAFVFGAIPFKGATGSPARPFAIR